MVGESVATLRAGRWLGWAERLPQVSSLAGGLVFSCWCSSDTSHTARLHRQ